MRKKTIWSRKVLFLLLALLVMPGCISLSQDVTPPPEPGTPTTLIPAPSHTPSPTTEQPRDSTQEAEQAEEARPGSVRVLVVDHTGEQMEAAHIVQLEGYDHADQVYFERIPTSSDGKAIFPEVPFHTGHYYFATVEYHQAVYRSDIVEVEPGTESLQLTIDLFETTTDTSSLSVDRIHVFLDDQQEDRIQIGEVFIVSNYGERTVVAENEGEPVLSFPLPEQAANLAFDDGALGQRFLETDRGFGDVTAIPPGSGVYQVMAYYTLPYQGGKIEFLQEVNYPVGAVIVITPVGSVQVKGTYLKDLGVREVQNGSIHVYAGEEISRGDQLQFQISTGGDPMQTLVIKPLAENPYLWLLLGMVGGGLIVLGFVFYFRDRSTREAPQKDPAVDREQNEILDSIIALDDLYDEGEVAESDYRKKRSELKSRLRELLKHNTS